ncbi:MAG: hypothetical protein ACMUJM_04755 [bacterium]
MYKKKRICIVCLLIIMAFIAVISVNLFLSVPVVFAADPYWAAIPPYNVLWPLFSPVLSPPVGPVDPITGVAAPVPLVSSLTNNTVLPVQPALVFDPCQPNVAGMGFLVYNTPAALGGGLTYWDPYYGLNPWPPSYMLDTVTGAPLPITLPVGWSFLDPGSLIDLKHFEWFVPLGNAAFSLQFQVPYTSLLTTADIWGNLIPPLTALTPPIF